MFGNTENIQPIITYTVKKNILEIDVPKRDDVDLSKIYTRQYFEKFGLNVIKVNMVDNPPNMVTSLNVNRGNIQLDSNTQKTEEDTESVTDGLTDKQEFIPNIKSEQEMEREIKEKGLEEVILGKREANLKNGYEVLPLHKDEEEEEEEDLSRIREKEKEKEETSKGVGIVIKLKKGQYVIGLREYQERRKEEEEEEGEEDMERVSGLNYNEIEGIIEGINKSVNEYEIGGKQIIRIDRENILKVGERFLLLNSEFRELEEEEEEEEMKKEKEKKRLKEILKEIEVDKECIKGTRIMNI